MTLTTSVLMKAMDEAARLSRDGLIISVALTREGFVVLGAKDGFHIGRDVSWQQVEESPGRLIAAIQIVRDRL